ncbi:hypothetical protein Cni_G10428 [Canna indica]|uniref:S phase cyclin A-associated protein in the endoplasmic reticulum N-terminal domain-containing protein n=1 Tax=Canna indica TaxID=4628 RepID=A0AAQ3Q9W0_9LILI|nr:hypothetical protein Cni_G10428 [Canna indica]
MMENNSEAVDDMDSGWFEVKKKHRTSRKLTIPKASGASLTNIFSPKYHSSTDDETTWTGNSDNKKQFSPSKALDCAALKDVDNSVGLKVKITEREVGTKTIEKVTQNKMSVNVSKIKWGDLEDATFNSHDYSQNISLSVKAASGDLASCNLLECGNSEKENDSILDVPSCNTLLAEEVTMSSPYVEQLPSQILASDIHQDSVELTWKEVKEFPSEAVDVGIVNQNKAFGSLSVNLDTVAKTTNETGFDLVSSDIKTVNSPASPVQGIVQVIPQDPHPQLTDKVLDTAKSSYANVSSGMMAGLGDGITPSRSDSEALMHMPAAAAAEIQNELHDGLTVGAGLVNCEPGESKERFRQRLWCFLFENLNRSVDELYLLCELECDMEQMNEALLVLEEATSDFRELKCRVGDFESTKSSSQLSKEGNPMIVKADHRRPHALSWEVRRMTTSPHRAEILSSSLEAFRKIQLDRAAKDINHDARNLVSVNLNHKVGSGTPQINEVSDASGQGIIREKQTIVLNNSGLKTDLNKQNSDTIKPGKGHVVKNARSPPHSLPASVSGKSKREPFGPVTEIQKHALKKDKELTENKMEKHLKAVDMVKKQSSYLDKEKDKQKYATTQWKSMDAWKEKRNWEDILKSPMHSSSRISYSPSVGRKVMDRARVLHDKLMSPEKKKKSAMDLRREAEEKHARAMRIRNQLESERVQKLQRTSEKLNRVTEWQAVRSSKLREVMYARHQRSESLHEAHLAKVVRKAGDESSKVNEVRFITSLNEQNKKLMLHQKLHDSEMRRAEKLQVIRTKQKEDIAREEAVLERRKLLEAEKLQRLAETQRKKEEAQVRREEERKASSAAREAKAVEHLRRKEIRARAQQEEAELLAQKLAEKLRESEQRRKYYLEQIREKASMDFRDQSSPLQRRLNKEGLSRSTGIGNEDNLGVNPDSAEKLATATHQHSLKRRIKRVRQKLMALKHDFVEPPFGSENAGIGNRISLGAAKAKIGRWVQELQRLRQARKEGAASIGLIVGDMIKFLEGKDLELHASRQARLLDFISSALPASHISKPEACQVTVHFLRLLRVLLSLPANRSYFLAQNLLPPIIPMLSASLENYIKAAASSSSGGTNLSSSKVSNENLESLVEIMDGFLWTVTMIVGHIHFDDRQLQMQDGLMELLIAYQVIHRLRDLFALYDRPQVEGSPFPSSILLSLTFLSVLTSRPGTFSAIEWESCVSKTSTQAFEMQESNDSQTMPVGESSVIINHSGDNKSLPTLHQPTDPQMNRSVQLLEPQSLLSDGASLSDTPEASLLGMDGRDSSGPVLQRQEKVSSSEAQNLVVEEHTKLFPMKKDEKNLNGSTERKRTDEHTMHDSFGNRKKPNLKQPLVFLLSAISETGLISLPSLLTAVLLQANNKLSSDQASYILPSNFEEVATGVLKVLNNLANLDISTLQSMLVRSDLKVEFFHLMSFLLTHCTNKWKAANDQVGLLLLESLLLLGYFSLFHHENQAVLRWGKSPTILHKVCDLPFVFFSDPDLTPILAGTLVAACYGCDQNKGIVLQELSTDMLLSLLKSCKQKLLLVQPDSLQPSFSMSNDTTDSNQMASDAKKSSGDIHLRSNRKNTQHLSGKALSSSTTKINKSKSQRDCRGTRTFDEWIFKHNLSKTEASSSFMLHWRFPISFLDKAEEFFSTETLSQQLL